MLYTSVTIAVPAESKTAKTADYFKQISVNNKKARQKNEEIDAMRSALVEDIVETAKANSPTYAETKNLREAREQEKQALNRMDTITARLDREEAKAIGKDPDAERIEEKKPESVETPGPIKEMTEEDYLKKVGNFYEYDYEEEDE